MTEPSSDMPPENPAKSKREWESFFARWPAGDKPEPETGGQKLPLTMGGQKLPLTMGEQKLTMEDF